MPEAKAREDNDTAIVDFSGLRPAGDHLSQSKTEQAQWKSNWHQIQWTDIIC